MQDPHGHQISYLRVSVTDRCNERCTYCMPQETQEWLPRNGVLSYEEILRLIKIGTTLGIHKIRITGGEPLTRRDITTFFAELAEIDSLTDIGISTNATLLNRPDPAHPSRTVAESLVASRVRTANISLDTLDRDRYAKITGRDYLPDALDAGFERVKINTVLTRGHTEAELPALIDFAHQKSLLLRFIELMPVSTSEVLHEDNFLPTNTAKKLIEQSLGTPLQARPDFKTNGPSSYYAIPGRDQMIGFIGAMTNLHFCESCNKLRLTCDGKLRPCLGSYLEFDIMEPLRAGATNDQLADFFRSVVDRKPKDHDFRDNYQPNRKMVAIGG